MGNRQSVRKFSSSSRRKIRQRLGLGHAEGERPAHNGQAQTVTICANMLTEEEIKNIQACWCHLDGKLNQVLTEAFLALFADHPDVKDKFFEFRNYTIEDLRRGDRATGSSALQKHVPRVARAVAKVASNVHNLDNILDYMQVLGKIHHQNGIRTHEIGLIGPYFVSAAVYHLPSHLRERKVQESWLKLFSVSVELMHRGYPDVELELTFDEKLTLRRCVEVLRTEVRASGGEATFLKLSHTSSGVHLVMPATSCHISHEDEMVLHEALATHGLLLLKVVEEFVRLMEDKPAQEQYLRELGRLHEDARVQRQYLDVMGPFFCQIIRPVLLAQSCWENQVRETWLHLFRIIAYQMKRGYVSQRQFYHPQQQQQASGRSKGNSQSSLEATSCSRGQTTSSSPDAALSLSAVRPPAQAALFQKHARRRISVDELQDRRARAPHWQHAHALNRRRIGGSACSVGRSDGLGLDSPLGGSSAQLMANANLAAKRRSSMQHLAAADSAGTSPVAAHAARAQASPQQHRPRSKSATGMLNRSVALA